MTLKLLLLWWLALTSLTSCLLITPTHAVAATQQQQLEQLRHAAKQQPNSPLAHIQLALALHELNHQFPDGGSRVPEAEQEYRKALALISPQGEHHAPIYVVHVQGNLGALLLSADRPAEAITELQAALTLGQQLQQQLQQQVGLGSSGSSSKQKKKSKKQKKSEKGGKRDGEQEQQQQQLQAELQEVEQQLGGLMFNLGKALTSVGRLDEADKLYAQAAAAAYGHDFGSYGKALAAMSSMQGAEVLAQALKACQAATKHFASRQPQLAFLKDYPPPPQSAADSSNTANAADSTATSTDNNADPSTWLSKADSVDLVWLHFALYKFYQHAKQRGVAWHYLQLGNRIMAAHLSHDYNKDARNLHNIKGIFRAPFVTSGLQDSSAVFVVGMPRSGSTLVEQMLASHSQVFAAGEDTALAPLTTAINSALASSAPSEHPAMLERFAEQYLTAMQAKVPASWSEATSTATATSLSRPSKPSRIVDKMLRNLWLVGYIHMLLPKSCIVHVVRHPMDVAMSCYAQPFGYSASALAWSWDLAAIASQLQMTWDLAEHWEEQLPGRVHTVFYEELVERPESVAAQLLSACGLGWEPGVLQFHQAERSVQTASMVQVRQPLYKTAVARWKHYKQQLEPLREELAPLIGKYEQMLQQRLSAAPVTPGAAAGSGASVEGASDSDLRDEL